MTSGLGARGINSNFFCFTHERYVVVGNVMESKINPSHDFVTAVSDVSH